MPNQNPAIQRLNENLLACVVWKDGELIEGEGIGIKPLMTFLRQDRAFFQNSCVADKVIGKAAALLLVLGGVKEVYGRVMSESAMAVLSAHRVAFSYGERTPFIQNRAGDGMCPLELAVRDISDPEKAFAALEKRIAELMAEKQAST